MNSKLKKKQSEVTQVKYSLNCNTPDRYKYVDIDILYFIHTIYLLNIRIILVTNSVMVYYFSQHYIHVVLSMTVNNLTTVYLEILKIISTKMLVLIEYSIKM